MAQRSTAESMLYQMTKDSVRLSDHDVERVVAGERVERAPARTDVAFSAEGAAPTL